MTATGVLVLGASWVVGTPHGAAQPPAPPAAGAALTCGTTATTEGNSDVDGDGRTDPVVGLPGRSPTGGIVVHGTRPSDSPRFLAGSAFAGIDASRSFGTAIARYDVNGDGCDDLAVSDPDHQGRAAVDLLWGSPKGIRTAGAVQVLDPQTGSDDDFGAAVALHTDGNTCMNCAAAAAALWVGAPGRTVDGKADAGAVEFFRVAHDGNTTHAGTVTENDVRGAAGAMAGNRFGSVLSAFASMGVDEGFFDGSVLAGVPNETVNDHPHAGAVVEIGDGFECCAGPLKLGARVAFTQGVGGVSGRPEAGDEFGASVSVADGNNAAIGVPGEDIGTIHDAGLVQTFGIHDDGEYSSLNPDGAITQNSPGVPGVAEAGDHFGASVAVGVQGGVSACTEFTWLPVREVVVGVPGEDNGGHADSGTVAQQTMSPVFTGGGDCSYRYVYRAFTQGAGTLLGGANEAGDEVGAAVDVTRGGNQPGLVIIGVPGESIGGLAEAGTVQTYDNRTGSVATVGNVGGRESGLRFGAVLPVD